MFGLNLTFIYFPINSASSTKDAILTHFYRFLVCGYSSSIQQEVLSGKIKMIIVSFNLVVQEVLRNMDFLLENIT